MIFCAFCSVSVAELGGAVLPKTVWPASAKVILPKLAPAQLGTLNPKASSSNILSFTALTCAIARALVLGTGFVHLKW